MLSLFRKNFFVAAVGLVASFAARAENVDLYYSAHDGTRQHAILFKAEKPKAAVLFIHGLQSHAEWMRASGAGEAFARRGVSVLAFDRRGSGRSSTERGYAASGAQLLKDVNDAVILFRKELRKQGLEIGRDIDLHLMANCFGVRIAVPYVVEAEKQGLRPFKSLIILAPSTHMRKQAEYNLFEKVGLLLKNDHALIDTPLQDEWFVSSGRGLKWIQNDPLSLRKVSVGLLKAAKTLTKITNNEIYDMRIPLMVMTGENDQMVDSQRAYEELFVPYKGVKRYQSFKAEHSLEFGPARGDFVAETTDWLVGSGVVERR